MKMKIDEVRELAGHGPFEIGEGNDGATSMSESRFGIRCDGYTIAEIWDDTEFKGEDIAAYVNHCLNTHGPLLEVARSMFEILEGRGCQDEEAWARKIKDAETVEVPV